MFPGSNPVFVVISPLTELMNDQVKEAEKLGIKAMRFGVDAHSDRHGHRGGTPETWLLKKKWRNILSDSVYRENIKGIVVNEVHVTYKW